MSPQYTMLDKITDDASQEETSLDNDDNPEERPLTGSHHQQHSLEHSFRGTSFKRLLSTTSYQVKSALFAGSHDNENGFDDESNSFDADEDFNGFNDEILSQSLTGSYSNHHHHNRFTRSHSRDRKALGKPLRNCVSPMSSTQKLRSLNAATSNAKLNSNEIVNSHHHQASSGTPAMRSAAKRIRTTSNSSTKSYTNNIELYNLNSLDA